MSEYFKFNWQKKLGETEISAPAKAIGMWLSTWMKMDGSNAYPSFQTLAAQSGYSVTTVKKGIKELIEAGWIIQVRKGGSPTGGERISNKYKAQIPTLGREDTGSGNDSVAEIGVLGQVNDGTRSSDDYKQVSNRVNNKQIIIESEYGEMQYCNKTKQWLFKEEIENGATEKNIRQTA